MTMDLSIWRARPANDLEATRTDRRQLGRVALAALLMGGVLIVVVLLTVLLLPAMLAAQPTFLG